MRFDPMELTSGERQGLHPFALAGALLDGKYRVDRVVAEGGFGVVYAGHHTVLDVPIAIKVLKPTTGDAAEQGERFSREAQTIAKLKHPCIVQVLDAGVCRPAVDASSSTAPLAWMVLEWLNGQTLKANLVERRGRGGRAPLEAMALLRPVLDAVAYAHSKQVVHRDLKPSNIMLSPGDGRTVVRVLDFGVAKVTDHEPISDGEHTRTRGAAHAFSRSYAAPEQLAGGRTGPWTDIHALGLLLTELLTDRPPYGSLDPTELYELVFNAERPSPAQSGVDVGPWQAIIERAVSLKPSRRFASVSAFAVALEQTLDAAMLAFASPRAARSGRAAKKETARSIASETTQSEVTATFSVVSSKRPEAGSKLAARRLRRTTFRLVAAAAMAVGSYVVVNGLRSSGGARDASAARPSASPASALFDRPADPALDGSSRPPATAAPDAPPAEPSAVAPSSKKTTSRVPAARRPASEVDSSRAPAPSARPELPAYVVE
jgi:serine/threonine-protein kinase